SAFAGSLPPSILSKSLTQCDLLVRFRQNTWPGGGGGVNWLCYALRNIGPATPVSTCPERPQFRAEVADSWIARLVLLLNIAPKSLPISDLLAFQVNSRVFIEVLGSENSLLCFQQPDGFVRKFLIFCACSLLCQATEIASN
ncbi:MAG TPA: hypothetical protein VGZ29_09925, partial [Terriglobia bacterium]|nr:hypothetical protein [Terriglobia bacterium]